ncbi:DUF2382 domain-containing protein [Planococcus salinus]|uniref:DUF2382 domain-containing protein n=1 Tax=Planococcus salinus TaxID=1848460 RepID=A0A3M8PCB3_9BACL|nr:DUF2382 domain-containing protein [Planococcus salinus]RNF41253.1 DUF2382 domain-containing protein [Planococcus salinus]
MAYNDAKLIGSFELQAQVYKKILELKEQGYREEDMYVIAKGHDHVDTLKDKTAVNFSTGDKGDWKDKFKSVFSKEDADRKSYTNISEDSTRSTDYSRDVEDGRILLYVDRNFASSHDTRTTTAGTNTDETRRRGTDQEDSLRLHEERLNVDKERVQTGEVNVGKNVVEEEKVVEVPVEREEVYVERRPAADSTETTADDSRDSGLTSRDAYEEDGQLHIPVTEERVDVSKKDVVSEEIVVGKRKVKDTERVNETVRREEVDVDETTDTERRGNLTDQDDRRGF